MLIYLYWAGLVLSGSCLIYQDFKTRLISTWLIILFTLSNVSLYLSGNSFQKFFENCIFCLSYFLFCYLILHLYFYLKTKTFQKILDSKVGWGDVLLFIAVGCTLTPEILIYFFTATFFVSVIGHFFVFKANKNVPLAGYLIIMFLTYMLLDTLDLLV
ncbi:MAG: prepilin peptidase [Bacteroidota bacterium]|nr:prepilin peptidase [Bacteroidota bacterium]